MIRIVKRTGLTAIQASIFRLFAILMAMITAGLFMLILSYNPVDIYMAMIKGAFGNIHGIKETMTLAIPLTVTSLGIAIAFRMRFWNIGAEGQLFMGAFAASFFALQFHDVSKPILLIIMALAGMVGGAIWGLIPVFFKAQFGTNETLFTLMMNYIALKWVTFLQYGPWKDPDAHGFPQIPYFTDNAILPDLFGVNIGWIIALALVVIIHIFIRETKQGYEISVIGESVNTARYAGMNVKKIVISAIMLSGGLCGLAGMIQASGVSNTLSVDVTGGIGYTAIITTWLGQLNALAIVIVSILFAAMIQGGAYIQTAFQIPQAAATILQGLILFFVLGSEFFMQFKIKIQHNMTTESMKGDAKWTFTH